MPVGKLWASSLRDRREGVLSQAVLQSATSIFNLVRIIEWSLLLINVLNISSWGSEHHLFSWIIIFIQLHAN